MTIANIPGSCLTEQVDQETVRPAKVTISTERKKTRDMLGELVEDRVDVAVEGNNAAATSAVSFSGPRRHSVLDTESSSISWIPAGVYPVLRYGADMARFATCRTECTGSDSKKR